MKNVQKVSSNLHWLSEKLKTELRDIFEPRYKRKLTEAEIVEIATNLVGYFELLMKMDYEQKQKSKIKKTINT